MRFRTLPVAAILLVAGSAFALAQEAVTIKWSPKEGETLKYKATMTSAFQGSEMEMSMSVAQKVLSIKDGKVTVEERTSGMKISFGGMDVTDQLPPEMAEPPIITTTYDLAGALLSRKESKQSEMNSPRLSAFVFGYPQNALKVGEKWTTKHSPDKDKGTNEVNGTFTYEGTEEVDGVKAYKIATDMSEAGVNDPISMTGTTWVSPATGIVIKSDYKMKNVPTPMGPMEMNMKMTLVK